MDQKLTPKTRDSIYQHTWQHSIKTLIALEKSFKNLESANIQLPCGFKCQKNNFTDIYQFKAYTTWTAQISQSIGEFNHLPHNEFNPVMLFSIGKSVKTNRPYRRLIQRIPAQLIDPFYTKLRGFYYNITKGQSKDSITISKTLITSNLKEIEKQAHVLLKECNRFYCLYCEPETPKPMDTLPF